MSKLILGIETSCDDTSIAIIEGDPKVLNKSPKVLAHQSFSQELLLKRWGGVVPEIAARNHVEKITPLLDECLNEAKVKMNDISIIGITTHPGLLGPLLTGINAAKSLALLYQTPIVSINHLYAHLEAIYLTEVVPYPYLGLLVSGGHTLYLKVEGPRTFTVLGQTIDDAAGEAFDKGGKLMGLGYPAGKIIDELAVKGDKAKYSFPISLLDTNSAHLSFSGVKTALRNFLEDKQKKNISFNLDDVCASYQEAIVGALAIKLETALQIANNNSPDSSPSPSPSPLPIVVGGGVACNSRLRSVLKDRYGDNVHFVAPRYCTDNGAMIANYSLRIFDDAINFPDCLKIDAKGQFVSKKNILMEMRQKQS